jgi:hypothetical protein
VLLYRGKVKTATTRARRRVEEEIYSSEAQAAQAVGACRSSYD